MLYFKNYSKLTEISIHDEKRLCWCLAYAARAVAFRLLVPLQCSSTILLFVPVSSYTVIRLKFEYSTLIK